MKVSDIKKFLATIGVSHVQNSGVWIRGSCPFGPFRHKHGHDANPSFGVKVNDAGRSFYNCFSCVSSGDLEDLLIELVAENKKKGVDLNVEEARALAKTEVTGGFSGVKDFEEFKAEKITKMEPWPEWWLDSFPKVATASVMWAPYVYLMNRGVSLPEMEAYDVRYDPHENRVCFPIRDANGALVGLRGRSLAENPNLRYRDYVIKGVQNNTSLAWYGAQWYDPDKRVVLTEGIFDCIAVRQFWSNTITAMSVAASKQKLKFLADGVGIAVLFDNDEGGDEGFEKVKKTLGESLAVTRIVIPDGMMNSKGEEVKDASGMDFEQLKYLMSKHGLLDPSKH